MTKNYILETINKESFISFCNFINNNPENNIDIYLDSPGGCISSLSSFLHIINSEPTRFKIITFNIVGSTAFDLLLYSKCEKIIGKLTRGMTHLSTINIDVTSRNTPAYGEGVYFKLENKERYIEETNEFIKIYKLLKLPPSTLTHFKQGYEIYFNTEQIKEILKLEWNYE